MYIQILVNAARAYRPFWQGGGGGGGGGGGLLLAANFGPPGPIFTSDQYFRDRSIVRTYTDCEAVRNIESMRFNIHSENCQVGYLVHVVVRVEIHARSNFAKF